MNLYISFASFRVPFVWQVHVVYTQHRRIAVREKSLVHRRSIIIVMLPAGRPIFSQRSNAPTISNHIIHVRNDTQGRPRTTMIINQYAYESLMRADVFFFRGKHAYLLRYPLAAGRIPIVLLSHNRSPTQNYCRRSNGCNHSHNKHEITTINYEYVPINDFDKIRTQLRVVCNDHSGSRCLVQRSILIRSTITFVLFDYAVVH